LPKLLPYRRLKIFAIFAAVGSLESVGMQQLRQYATTLGASFFQKMQAEKCKKILWKVYTVIDRFFYSVVGKMASRF
jgi:hypothetical protein